MTWHHVALVTVAAGLLALCVLAGHTCSDAQVNSLHTIAAMIVGVAGGNAMPRAGGEGIGPIRRVARRLHRKRGGRKRK